MPACGGGGSAFDSPESAAEAYAEAFRKDDTKTYCPRVRRSAVTGRASDRSQPLGPLYGDNCERNLLFESLGSYDVKQAVATADVAGVAVDGTRAGVRLSSGGAMGLERQGREWVVVCLAARAQVRTGSRRCAGAGD